jgi:hypothetical protein
MKPSSRRISAAGLVSPHFVQSANRYDLSRGRIELLMMKASALTLAHAPQRSVNPRQLRLRVMDLTIVIRDAVRMRPCPCVQFILPSVADGRSIVLHGYEIAPAESRPRLVPFHIEKRVLKSARPAKGPAPIFFHEWARVLPTSKGAAVLLKLTATETALATG